MILSDSVVGLIIGYPTVLTLVSTVISTILSVITTLLLSFAVKKAINHYITRPISLVKLHTAIALTISQPLLRWDYYKLSLLTLIFVGLITLLNSSWTTLLLPTLLWWPVTINGTDLDLGSSAFNAKLGSDLNAPGHYQSGLDLIDIMASTSGTSATRLAVVGGSESIFAFNGVSYDTSSGGILPAVEDYAGTTSLPIKIGLEYYGGQVAANTSLSKYKGRYGLARTYTVTQQGFSAHINCTNLSALDPNQYSMSFNNFTSLNTTTTTWEWEANCPLGAGSGYWSTKAFWEDDSESPYDGLLAIIVCPELLSFVDVTVTKFDVFLQGMAQYSFLNAMVCNVTPYVASFDVTYNQSMISVYQLQHGPIRLLQNSPNVAAFVLNVVSQLSISSQTTYNNPLGELLHLIDPNDINNILENYFRGLVEFSGTYLRSSYSAEGANTDSTMQDLYSNPEAFTPLNGIMYVSTYGWDGKRLTYIYILCVFTVIWAVTVAAAVFSLIQERTHPRTCPTFDASNPVHLMVASSAGGLETLARFEDNGALENDRARVRLSDGRDVAPDDEVGEKTSARPTGSTMPRFEIVP